MFEATVVVAAVAVAVWGTYGAHTPAAAVTATPSVVTPDPADAIVAWGNGGGGEHAHRVARAMALVGTAGGDASLARAYCTSAGEVVAEAQKFRPIPDAEAERHWSRGLGYARDAARSCVYAATTGDQQAWRDVIATSPLVKAEFEQATARIEAIQAGG